MKRKNNETFLDWHFRKILEIKTILSNEDYMIWLEKFTKSYHYFTDASWLYSPQEISEEDYNNIAKLGSLFEALEQYADTNYIPAGKCEFGTFYTIAFNNKAYKIGVASDQEIRFYCEQTKPCSSDIRFNDIYQKKSSPNVAEINDTFNQIKDNIYSLNKKFSLPLDTITRKISEIIISLKNNIQS